MITVHTSFRTCPPASSGISARCLMSAPRWTSCSSPRTSPADIWGTQEADGPGLLEAKQKLASWQLNKRRNDSHELSLKSSSLTAAWLAAGSDSGRKAGGRSTVLPAQLSAVMVPGAAQVRHLDECKVSNAAAGLNNPRSAHTRTLQATHFPRATPLPLLQGPARQMIPVLSQ